MTEPVHVDDTTTVPGILFVSWWGGGNMTPVLALSAAMRERGHEVTVLGPERYAARLALDDVTHFACPSWTPTIDDVRDAVARARPDLLVVDFMMADVLAVAPTLGVRTAALVHTLWQPVADREWDNIAAFTPLERINELRASSGLVPVDHAVEMLRDIDHVLIAEPEPIDWPVRSDWPTARYLGPLMEPPGPDADYAPLPGSNPLVVVGLGTTPMDEVPVLERLLEAIGNLDVARFLVTVGEHLDPRTFPEPRNTVVTTYLRHAAVLPDATAVVSHAGLGTTIAAAVHGLPMLCLPLGRDQPGNARRVVELGIGHVVAMDASVAELEEALIRFLADPDIRTRARELAVEIAARHPDPHGDFEALLRGSV